MHTGKNEDHIEIRGVNTEHSKKEPLNEASHERDMEESISLKATKPDVKPPKKNNKVSPEDSNKSEKNPFEKKITYISATRDELKERNLSDWRISVADFMRSKPVDIFIIVLIILYTLLVIVYLAIEDLIEDSDEVQLTLQIIELCFLFIFWVEISLNLLGFGTLFIKDLWNIADITVILLAIVFVVLEMVIDDGTLNNVFRIRGLFRLLRVGILIRKFDAIRQKSQARKRLQIRDIYHVSSPAEIVNEILCEIRDMVQNDDRMIEDLNYCIKTISSGKLYETNVFDGDDVTDDKQKDALAWAKSIQGKSKDEKRNSKDTKMLIQSKLQNIDIDSKLSLTKDSRAMLEWANSIDDFNIFEFKEEVDEQELFVLSSYLMHKHGLFQNCKIDPEVYFKFIKRIQDNYNPQWIEYHNKTHGADVCQTSYFFLEGWDFRTIGKITDFEFASIIIAASCHDFEHPGVNNGYLVNARAPWALEYNDKSPLENHHIAATFMILEDPEYLLFNNFSPDEYKEVRKNMIEVVLATDAAHHFNETGKFKARVGAEDFAPDGDDKWMIVKMMVHLADISNPCKPFNLALSWTGLLYDEFFKQGDREAGEGRSISFLMDRKTVNIAGSSIGFAKMLVQPAYDELVKVIPKGKVWLDHLANNIEKWEELKDEFEKKKTSGENYIEESRGLIKDYSSGKLPSVRGEHSIKNGSSLLPPPL